MSTKRWAGDLSENSPERAACSRKVRSWPSGPRCAAKNEHRLWPPGAARAGRRPCRHRHQRRRRHSRSPLRRIARPGAATARASAHATAHACVLGADESRATNQNLYLPSRRNASAAATAAAPAVGADGTDADGAAAAGQVSFGSCWGDGNGEDWGWRGRSPSRYPCSHLPRWASPELWPPCPTLHWTCPCRRRHPLLRLCRGSGGYPAGRVRWSYPPGG